MPQTSLSGLLRHDGPWTERLSLGLMPQTSLSGPIPVRRLGPVLAVSGAHAPDFVERKSRTAQTTPWWNAVSGAHAPDFVERLARSGMSGSMSTLSLGLMPQTSLSAQQAGEFGRFLGRTVSGAHAPDFVERCPWPTVPTHSPSVSGAHAPDFVERTREMSGRSCPTNCLWGSCPRLR